MWLNIPLFVFAAENIFGRELSVKYLVVGVFLIVLMNASWLIKPKDGVTLDDLLQSPDIIYGQYDYLTRASTLPPYPRLLDYGFNQIPLMTVDKRLVLDKSMILPLKNLSPELFLILKGQIEKTAQTTQLQLFLQDKMIMSKIIRAHDMLNFHIPIGLLATKFFTDSQTVQLSFKQKPLTQPDKKHSRLVNILPIKLSQFELVNNHALPLIPLHKIKPGCSKEQALIKCEVNIKEAKAAVQIPLLYYPQALKITLDGQAIPYDATFLDVSRINKKMMHDTLLDYHDWSPFLATTIIIPQGMHMISAQFVGLAWANKLSLFSWLLLPLFGLSFFVLRYRHTLHLRRASHVWADGIAGDEK